MRLSALVFLSSIFLLAGCSSAPKSDGKSAPIFYAVAVVNPTKGNKTSGLVTFSEGFGKIKVEAEIRGLEPKSKHGFHIHEYGDCTADNAESAGSHYNPGNHQHGGPHSEHPTHLGDLGNIEADEKGNAKLRVEIDNASIAGQLNPIIGRSVIVHKNPDDLISQPAGGAGERIACGVIGAAKK